MSKQSSKQLFSLLRKFFEYVNSNNDIEQKELAIYIPTIERLLAAIFSFIRYQTAVSWPLFEQLVVNKDMIVSISKCQIDPWKDYAALLLPIIEAAEQPINDFHAIMSKNANIINSHNNLTDANANNNLNNSILRLSRSDLFNINSNDNLNSPGRIHYNRSGIVANIVDDSLNSQIRPRKYSCEIINVHNAVSPVLARYNEMPNVPKIEFRMTPEIEIIWFDWFRVMLWQLFPDDSQFYDLHFVSFSLLENQKIKKNNNFIFDIKNNTEEEDNNDDDKI
ncbi:hypothetical protein TRFO_05059 [Tritrichomonas foetus]|uniref:Uncharacterized protein n=1 Tax=Tritrichomonas foetus TaxID=1144522 RepID=A0A1J4KE00_9EUKA|nr:hypothetical protein TRFO_05059 [Tritrichomonas foetus]|eukprot:OHT07940.1 hypothetical protein TRFO_05059 [Tritrichomonas foetus]